MAYIRKYSYKNRMDRKSLPIAILIVSTVLAPYLLAEDIGSLRKTMGQAEQTFNQNKTFLEEVELMQRQKQAEILAGQNETSVIETLTQKPLSEEIKAERPITNALNGINQPRGSIVMVGNNVYVIWETNKTGNWEVMFRASDDNGVTFKDKLNLSNSSSTDSENGLMTASENNLFVIWEERNPNNGTSESAFRISSNNGQTFGPILWLDRNGIIGNGQNIANLSTYQNSLYGIQLRYPSEWQNRSGGGSNGDHIVDMARFLSPFEYRLDPIRENLLVSLENLRDENITLEDYTRDLIDYKNETVEDFRLLDYNTDSNILGDHLAYRLVYTGADGNVAIKEMEIGTKIEDKVYFLTYSAEREKYAEYLPIIQDMIDSLEIKR